MKSKFQDTLALEQDLVPLLSPLDQPNIEARYGNRGIHIVAVDESARPSPMCMMIVVGSV
jgi:hypothetical protein